MPETTADVTDEQTAPKSKFGQMELDFSAKEPVGASQALESPPLEIKPVSWGDAQQFASAGGYNLVAYKNGSSAPGAPFEFTMLGEMKSLGWNVKLETADKQVLDIEDIKKLTGDKDMNWDKLMAPRDTDLFLNLPPVAPAAPTVQPEIKADPKPDPIAPPATNEAVEEDKTPKPVTPGPVADGETEEAREQRLRQERDASLKKAASDNSGLKVDPKPDSSDMLKQPRSEDDMSEEEKMAIAQARATFEKKGFMDTLMNAKWNAEHISDEFRMALGENGSIKENRKYGLDINLPNGHKLEWHENMGGAEFIGMTRNTKKFDLDDAHAVAAASKSRGWKAINAHGTVEQRDMIWLQAMRQGLEVANHTPLESSEYYKQWMKEQKEDAEALKAGVSPAAESTGPENSMKKAAPDNGGTPEMTPPAQVEPIQQSLFINPEAMAADKAAKEMQNKDSFEQFRDFIDRQEKANADNPEMLAKLKTLREQLDGTKPSMNPLDPDIAAAAAKDGVKVPEDIAKGAGNPNPVAAEKDKPKMEGGDEKTNKGDLSLGEFLKREIDNPKNSTEVIAGLKEMKGALEGGKITPDQIDAIQFGREMDNGGGVTKKQFSDIAEGITKALPDAKITRPNDSAFPVERKGSPTIIVSTGGPKTNP